MISEPTYAQKVYGECSDVRCLHCGVDSHANDWKDCVVLNDVGIDNKGIRCPNCLTEVNDIRVEPVYPRDQVYDAGLRLEHVVYVLVHFSAMAARVWLVLDDFHNDGFRGGYDADWQGYAPPVSRILRNKDAEILRKAHVTSEELNTAAKEIETAGWVEMVLDTQNNQRAFIFSSPTPEYIKAYEYSYNQFLRHRGSAGPGEHVPTAEELQARRIEYEKKLKDRENNPWKYCAGMSSSGKPCLSANNKFEGKCRWHRTPKGLAEKHFGRHSAIVCPECGRLSEAVGWADDDTAIICPACCRSVGSDVWPTLPVRT